MIDNHDSLFNDDDSEDDLLFGDDDSKDALFSEEDDSSSKSGSSGEEDYWNILVVDDEEQIHSVTEFALGDYEYKGKKLRFQHAYTGKEAIEILQKDQNIALILLDVVMESNDAGLLVVDKIRNQLQNHFVRIILRTGQPGQAPEEDVIIKYDINDYKNKAELTDKRLFATITTGLRSYADIMEIESYRHNLELKVQERTAEILTQKEVIEKKNEEITSSINYANRIQKAILPPDDKLNKLLPESFVLFKPRDIVSGDFYWLTEQNGKILVSAIDCTGHGVPGAFMSMIGYSLLNQIVKNNITAPEEILYHLHIGVRKALKQSDNRNRDGMDMAICTIDPQNNVVEFAGAKNPVVYIQDGEATQIKGDRMPIGGEQKEEERLFTRHIIKVDKPTHFYLFSDGYQDQFGGEHNKKYMIKRLRNRFVELHQLPFAEQKQILDQEFEEWRGDYRQTDDTLIVAFKLG